MSASNYSISILEIVTAKSDRTVADYLTDNTIGDTTTYAANTFDAHLTVTEAN